ncbi:hypothetical protein NDU88_003213 [Pleurodeles waltl]|uniref:Uncharacterized protein n=1 Tax=Pleurodeles waltl TaxID=8319 RepID=A0AAV7RD92_PLEWA|nr:hypothetical protein NDU88_003213 [Pleurodeles waltl]
MRSKTVWRDAEAGSWLTECAAVGVTELSRTRVRPGHGWCRELSSSDRHLEACLGLRRPEEEERTPEGALEAPLKGAKTAPGPQSEQASRLAGQAQNPLSPSRTMKR